MWLMLMTENRGERQGMVSRKAGGDLVYRKDIVPPPTTVGKLCYFVRLGGKTAIRGFTFDRPVITLKATIFIGL